jgi:hypothetical protein
MNCQRNINSTLPTQLPHKFSYIVAILGHNHFESPNTSLYFSGIKSVNPDDSPLIEHPELSTSENLHEKGAGDKGRVGRFNQPKEFSSSRLGFGEEKFGSGRFDRSRSEEEQNGRERRQRFSFDRIPHDADEELSFDQLRSGPSRDSGLNFVRFPKHRPSENERVRSKDSDSERLTRSESQESQRIQQKENQEKENLRSKRFKFESLDRSTSSENKRFGSRDDNLERLSRFGPQENERFRSKENHSERVTGFRFQEDESRESSSEESEEEESEERLQSRKRHFVGSHPSRHQESLHRSRSEENEQLQSRSDRVSRSRHQKNQRPHRQERLRGFRPGEEEVEEELFQSRNSVRSHPPRQQEDLGSSRPGKIERLPSKAKANNSERTSRSGSEDKLLKSRESNSEKSREEEEEQEERLQSKERNIVRSHPSRHQESLHRSRPEEKEQLQSGVSKIDRVSRSRLQKDKRLHPKERLRGARPEEGEDEVEEELLQSRERHFVRSHPSRRQEGLGRSRPEENNSEGTSRSGSEDERLRSQAWARPSHSSRNQDQEPKSRFEADRKSDRSSGQHFGNRRTETSEDFRSKSIPEPEKN